MTDFKCYFHLPFGISMIFYGCISLIVVYQLLIAYLTASNSPVAVHSKTLQALLSRTPVYKQRPHLDMATCWRESLTAGLAVACSVPCFVGLV